jgi:serine/threonine-protein kinase
MAMALYSRSCDPRRLDLLLRNQLPEEGQRDLEAHLVVCPACREELDDLAGGAHWWSEVRRHLGGDGVAQVSATSDAAGPRAAGIDLEFLEPSENPTCLGRLGAYEILDVVGRGGMGVVLKAFDPALHRPVAIKVLAPEYAASGSARKRFAREAQAAAAVVHDHVVPVHAVDAEATPPFLVMAFIPGQSLQQRVDQSGPLELAEILRIGMQTAAGLAAAHTQGLVHRDIKPANIMLENGIERVRITDFGLARAVDDASVTQAGLVAGTPQYMAPEQAGGEVVDQRADLFALGSTLYFMATGRPPFRGDGGMAVIRQVCDIEPTPMRALNPHIPRWLEGIVRRLHAKEPAKRFQSAAEVSELLERCLAHVHQPNQNSLPRLAQELGRQVPSIGRPGGHGRFWLAAGVLAAGIAAAAALYLVPRPWLTEPGGESGVTPAPNAGTSFEAAELAGLEDQISAGSHQVRTRLDGLYRSFGSEASVGTFGLEAALDAVQQRADALRRDLSAGAAIDLDPIDVELESIRRRLERLQQGIAHISQ